MLTQSLADAKERGELVSLLKAAEWPIYGRFGYWPAVLGSNYRLSVDPAGRSILRAADRPPADRRRAGRDLPEPAAEVHPPGPAAAAPATSTGPADWQRRLGLGGLRPPGTRRAGLRARPQRRRPGRRLRHLAANDGDWFLRPDQAQAEVSEVLAATDDAYRALWHYLLNLDLVRVADAERLPGGRAAGVAAVRRPGRAAHLDRRQRMAAAAGRPGGAVGPPLRRAPTGWCCEVVDPDGGWAAGRFTLDGGPAHAECRAGTPAAPADLRLSQRALAAIYLGGNTVRSQQLAGLVDEETPGAAARLESMFCHRAAAVERHPVLSGRQL